MRHLSIYFWLILFFLQITACAKNDNSTPDQSLTGTWEYHHIQSQASNGDFIESVFFVGIEEQENTVKLDQCDDSLDKVFTKNGNILSTEFGEKIQIVNEETLESLSIGDLTSLKKVSSKPFSHAGSVSMSSESFSEINLQKNVCAQQYFLDNSDQTHIKISFPFETTQMMIELKFSDINKTPNNIDEMTLTSPSFVRYFNSDTLTLLTGNIELEKLDEAHANIRFDITTVASFNRFPGDHLTGQFDVHFE